MFAPTKKRKLSKPETDTNSSSNGIGKTTYDHQWSSELAENRNGKIEGFLREPQLKVSGVRKGYNATHRKSVKESNHASSLRFDKASENCNTTSRGLPDLI